jgi:SEL1 protein
MSFFGNFTYPRNYTEAFRRYLELASLDGNSSAQHMVGFMYATGIGDAVERDQAKALLYHSFAAQAGHTKSQMTVAFRHHIGIGTARNCDDAVQYYKKVADKAIRGHQEAELGYQAHIGSQTIMVESMVKAPASPARVSMRQEVVPILTQMRHWMTSWSILI